MNPTSMSHSEAKLGHGVGLRAEHYKRALASPLDVDWVEVISENFFAPADAPTQALSVLEKVRQDLPVGLHGVSMGIGSKDPPDSDYLAALERLIERIEPAVVSDHLCWGRVDGAYAHELLPLMHTEAEVKRVSEHIARVQDRLRRPLLLENISTYTRYEGDEMSEWEFVSEVAAKADCYLLLDLNNIVVNSYNHNFSTAEYLNHLDYSRIKQVHLANHTCYEDHRFDDHRGPVADEVWELLRSLKRRMGDVPTLIEWDDDIPSWEVLRAEQLRAKSICAGKS